jgi:hypothetical protein
MKIINNNTNNHLILSDNDNSKHIKVFAETEMLKINCYTSDNTLNFKIFDTDIDIRNKLVCENVNFDKDNDCPLSLYHELENPILLNFNIPLVLFSPEDKINTEYSLLVYTNYGFFGVYSLEYGDLVDKSHLPKKHRKNGKLPCSFDVKVENVIIPPEKSVNIFILLVNSHHTASGICENFKNIKAGEDMIYNIDYRSTPVYFILDNFSITDI